jgi:hypothetical protein
MKKEGHELRQFASFCSFILDVNYAFVFFSAFLKFFNVVFAYISLITHVCMVCKNMGGPMFFFVNFVM